MISMVTASAGKSSWSHRSMLFVANVENVLSMVGIVTTTACTAVRRLNGTGSNSYLFGRVPAELAENVLADWHGQ